MPEIISKPVEDSIRFILLPENARKRYLVLLESQQELLRLVELSGFNILKKGKSRKTGIIACGIASNYCRETELAFKQDFPVLQITNYPFSHNLIHDLSKLCDEILVLEDGYPLVEEMLSGIFKPKMKIRGRLDGSLPRTGELNPDLVMKALGFQKDTLRNASSIPVSRPPALCKGCSHADMYLALNEAMEKYNKGKVFSDIGCYTLGALPPYNSINTCVDMGASVSMAKGASDAGLFPAVAVIGDSTFTHSGITALIDAVNCNSPITVIISDNSTTGMTGGQPSAATGRIESICTGVGVNTQHVITIDPIKKNHGKNTEIIIKELKYKGVSVIISARECIQTAVRNRKRLI